MINTNTFTHSVTAVLATHTKPDTTHSFTHIFDKLRGTLHIQQNTYGIKRTEACSLPPESL
jgi:hypothetical protein